jgi:hypothetical protein
VTTDPALKALLDKMDPGELGITSQKELFEHLYEQSETEGYSKEDVDLLLGEEVGEGDVELLRQRLLQNAEGPLKEYLENLDLEAGGITSPEELISHLKEAAEEHGFSMEEVREAMLDSLDQGLADSVAEGDLQLLLQKLKENAEGPLKAYLEGLDPEAEGISSAEELIRHLKEAAENNGYTVEDLRKAMVNSLKEPLEVERTYQELLEIAQSPVREILEDMDLRKAGIYTIEELISTLYRELKDLGYSKREIRRLLTDLFDSHADFIKNLVKRDGEAPMDRKAVGDDTKGFPAWIVVLLGAGLFILFFLLWRRRRNKEQSQ